MEQTKNMEQTGAASAIHIEKRTRTENVRQAERMYKLSARF